MEAENRHRRQIISNLSPSSSHSPRWDDTPGRRLLVIRHGERIDFTFNPTHQHWVKCAFDKSGTYKRFNINMPRMLPSRRDGYDNYFHDTPLTEMGYLQAKLTGRALKDSGCRPDYIYASCAYRSIQTAVGIIKGLGGSAGDLKIRVEPGLFEWGSWFNKIPGFMEVDELAEHGLPIDTQYSPYVTVDQLVVTESLADYYNRSHLVTRHLMQHHCKDKLIALVAHGASLDACTRQLVGHPVRSQKDFYTILHQTPYLALTCCREDPHTSKWSLCDPPIYPFQHQGNAPYDWKQLKTEFSSA